MKQGGKAFSSFVFPHLSGGKNKASLGYQESTFLSLSLPLAEWAGNNVGRLLREISSPLSHHQAPCDGNVETEHHVLLFIPYDLKTRKMRESRY